MKINVYETEVEARKVGMVYFIPNQGWVSEVEGKFFLVAEWNGKYLMNRNGRWKVRPYLRSLIVGEDYRERLKFIPF
jgi:hypothetical protein